MAPALTKRAIGLLLSLFLLAPLKQQIHLSTLAVTLMLAGVHDSVRKMKESAGPVEAFPAGHFFWSSDQTILAAQKNVCILFKSLRRLIFEITFSKVH